MAARGASRSEEHGRSGRSTTSKVIAGAAIGVGVPAAVGVARKLMRRDSDEPEQRPSGQKHGDNGSGTTKTRAQLYKQATRLKIEGRSRMTKAQLERAI